MRGMSVGYLQFNEEAAILPNVYLTEFKRLAPRAKSKMRVPAKCFF